MRFVLVLVVAFTLVLAGPAAAQDPAAPTVTTQLPEAVTATAATFVASVDPNGAETTVRFDYGPTTAFGSQTEARSVGTGTDTVRVEVRVTGLTPNTTYNVRAVAINEHATVGGGNRQFTTPPQQAPTVATLPVTQIQTDGATLQGSVDPNGRATRAYFLYGVDLATAKSTPPVDIGAGSTAVPLSAKVTGLPSGRRILYRMMAITSGTTYQGPLRNFNTRFALTGVSLTVSPTTATYGASVRVRGRVRGTGSVSSVPVRVEARVWPYTSAFVRVGNVLLATATGTYSTTVGPLLIGTQLRVTTLTNPSVRSTIRRVNNRARVGLRVPRRVSGGRLSLGGTVRPRLLDGVATLQRRTSRGRWTRVARTRLRADGARRSRYAFRIKHTSRRRVFRVVVIPNDDNRHARGTSVRRREPRR